MKNSFYIVYENKKFVVKNEFDFVWSFDTYDKARLYVDTHINEYERELKDLGLE